LFYNPSKYRISFVPWKNHGEPPTSGQSASKDAYGDLKAAISQQSAEGYTILLLDIHSHPPDDITGNGLDENDYDQGNAPSGDDRIASASWDSRTVGIVIIGKGKFNTFRNKGADNETFKRTCLILLCQIKKCLHLRMSFCRTRCR